MSLLSTLSHIHVRKPMLAMAGLCGLALAAAACATNNDPSGGTPDEYARKIIDAYDKPDNAGAKDGVLNLNPPPGTLSSQDERVRLRTSSNFGPELFGDDWVSESSSQLVSNMRLFTAADTQAPTGSVTLAELAAVIATFDTNSDGKVGSTERDAFARAYPEVPESPESRSRAEW